jgi:hypothetical protein
MNPHPRLRRELTTIGAMVQIYCRDHHDWEAPAGVCPDCSELLVYAEKRLDLCPFQQDKPTCGNCTIHCYKQDMRDKVRKVMRYSGPKMIFRHPVLAIFHLLDGRKKFQITRFPDRAGKHKAANHPKQ